MVSDQRKIVQPWLMDRSLVLRRALQKGKPKRTSKTAFPTDILKGLKEVFLLYVVNGKTQPAPQVCVI